MNNKTVSRIWQVLTAIAAVVVAVGTVVACLILLRVGAAVELSMPSMQDPTGTCFLFTNNTEEVSQNELH